jgi:hypothetical protein
MAETTNQFAGEGAAFSDCRRYRYAKWHTFASGTKGTLVVIGLAPAPGDATNDSVFKTCRDFAAEQGYAALIMVNLFAIQNLDPADLASTLNPAGRDNDAWLKAAAARAQTIVVAWGDYPRIRPRVDALLRLLESYDLYSVQNNKNGTPAHPAAWRLKAPKMYRRRIADVLPVAG